MPETSAAAWVQVPRFPLIGIAHNVRSLYNIGAMFRASDAARVSHLYLTGMSGHPASSLDRIGKTALGATAVVPWTYAQTSEPVIAALQGRGVTVAALELTPSSQSLTALEPVPFPLALLVGHETDGVPEELVSRCDLALALPVYGRKASLNVALAYGVAIMELARRYVVGQAAAGCRIPFPEEE